MRFPLKLTARLTRYIAGKRIGGEKMFPLVMMLEPLHACNLTCTGCGRIREYKSTINEMLTVEQCIAAMEECGAPVVSICGGEPTIYPELGRLVREILARGRHIYLCTNGMFIRKRLHEFRPTTSFFWNVHLDGLERTHDLAVERDGVFREAIEGIKAAKAAGFLVCSNTTIYKETDLNEIAELYAYLHELGVDGLMISPIYLEYLRGQRELMCTAWGNPTYNPRGWKGPCYLITDAHHATFREFIENTPWERYGRGRDPRCQDCMVHVGYEPSAVLGAHHKLGDNWKMLKWQLSGRMGGARRESAASGANSHGNGHNGSHATDDVGRPVDPAELVSPDGSLRVL